MRRLALIVAAAAVAAVGAADAPASTTGPVKVAPVRAEKFPERAYVLTLPQGTALIPHDLRVFENGERVSDLAVTATSAIRSSRFGIVLAIDASNSMRGEPIEAALEAARAFAGHRNANQRLAIATFGDRARITMPLTAEDDRIERTLAQAPRLTEGTALYDVIDRATRHLKRARVRSGSIVLLSDGADVRSRLTERAAIELARRNNVRIFTVGLASEAFDPATLQRLARATGGTFTSATTPAELRRIYGDLGATLANEYLVEYRSLAPPSTRVEVAFEVAGADAPATARYTSPKLDLPPVPAAAYQPSTLDRIVQAEATTYALAALVALIVTWIVVVALRTQDGNLRGRLSRFVSMAHSVEATRHTALLTERVLAGTDRSLRRTRAWPRFKEALDVAEIRTPAEQIVVLTVIGTVTLLWLLALVSDFPTPLLAAVFPAGVYLFLKRKIQGRYRAFEDQLPDNLEVLASALRAGHSFLGALAVAVDDSADPSKREFRRVLQQEQLGVPLEDALETTRRRLRNRDMEQIALVAALQRQTGSDSAEVLDRVTENVRARAEIRRLVRVLTAQGRFARWVLTGLPMAFFLVLMLMHPDYLDPLLHERLGQVLLAFGILLLALGSLAIKKIVDIKV